MLPLLKPSCTDAEIAAVTRVLKSGWWGMGRVCEEVEQRLAWLYDYKFCLTMNSATAALHLSVLANNIGPGDEVIVPALTFVSTALAVSYVGATPVFADVDPNTLCVGPHEIASLITERTKAVIPVDYAGYPAIALLHAPQVKRYTIIQDAAHSCGGVGYGNEVCLSFHPVKNIACGDGGAVLTNDEAHYNRMKALRWCGIDRSTWERSEKKYGWDYSIEEVGYKCHLSDIQAALVSVQLKRMAELLDRRREIAHRYEQALSGLCETPVDHPMHTWHLYPIRVPVSRRNSIIDYMLSKGISVGVHYKPLTYYKMYADTPTPPVTEREWKRLISLPIFYDMTDEDVDMVIRTLKETL